MVGGGLKWSYALCPRTRIALEQLVVLLCTVGRPSWQQLYRAVDKRKLQ